MDDDVESGGDASSTSSSSSEEPYNPLELDRTLGEISRNRYTYFSILEAFREDFMGSIVREEDKLTVPHAIALTDALKQSTVVEKFEVRLEFCSIPSIQPFVDYIRSSTLQNVRVDYQRLESCPDWMHLAYKSQIDRIFRAIPGNESVQTVEALALGNPASIYDLLANTKSLKELIIACCCDIWTEEMSLAVSSGMSKNSSINKLLLTSNDGSVAAALSGLGASSVESLHIRMKEPDAKFWEAISRMLFVTPSLSELELWISTASTSTDGGCGKIFSDLRHPARRTAGLKSLKLTQVLLGGADDSTIPKENANTSLQALYMNSVCFQTPRDVHLLWNVVGLEELVISAPTHNDFSGSNSDDFRSLQDYWTQFIRRNENMATTKVYVSSMHFLRPDDISASSSTTAFLYGIMEGARGLKSLTSLEMDCGPMELGDDIAERVNALVQETPLLGDFDFISTGLNRKISSG